MPAAAATRRFPPHCTAVFAYGPARKSGLIRRSTRDSACPIRTAWPDLPTASRSRSGMFNLPLQAPCRVQPAPARPSSCRAGPRPALAVLKKLRVGQRDFSVIILTARGAWAERVEGIDAGADDYLTKPFAMEEWLARVRELFPEKGGGRGDRAGDEARPVAPARVAGVIRRG